MVRIWAQILTDNRIIKQIIFEDYSNFSEENFFEYMATISSELDIATPVILSKHINHYINFNNAVFFPEDFPESVNFDRLVLEDASKY